MCVYICVCVYIYVYMYVCVCVCYTYISKCDIALRDACRRRQRRAELKGARTPVSLEIVL